MTAKPPFAVPETHREPFAVAFAVKPKTAQPSQTRNPEAFAYTLREPRKTARPRRVQAPYREGACFADDDVVANPRAPAARVRLGRQRSGIAAREGVGRFLGGSSRPRGGRIDVRAMAASLGKLVRMSYAHPPICRRFSGCKGLGVPRT